jgi:hypothetical protein
MPFNGATTQRADFTPKKGRTQSARPADQPIPYSPLDDGTTYNAHYPAKRAELEVPPEPVYHDRTAPFMGISTYNADYLKKQSRPWTADAPLPPPRVRLDDSTEYRDEFYRKPLLPRSPRASQPLLPSTHVPTITTYGHDYVPKPFEERERTHCCADETHPANFRWMSPAVCRARKWGPNSCTTCVGGSCLPGARPRHGRAPMRRAD